MAETPPTAHAVLEMETRFVETGHKVPAVHCMEYAVFGQIHSGSLLISYQFCGNDTAHCGSGCQSGPCVGPPAVPVPGPSPAPANPSPGSFQVVGQSGVPAMHAGLMPNGRVVFLDKVENYTQIKLSDGQYAYSAEYDLSTNSAVGLSYKVGDLEVSTLYC